MDLVEELKKLVSIKTDVKIEDGKIVRENYDKIADSIAELASRLGLDVQILELKDEHGVIPTVIVSIDVDKPTLAFPSHYDVVPAGEKWVLEDNIVINPYEPLVKDGKVYGRGAADDKSAIISSIAALEELSQRKSQLKYKPVVIVTGDEEVGGNGIKLLLDKGYRWDNVVILDANANYLSIGASGVVHGWIRVRGKAGHAGYPHLAINPIDNLALIIREMNTKFKSFRASKISRYNSPPGSPVPKLWGRFTFTIIKMGSSDIEKHNRIPSEAIIGFDMRLLPEEKADNALKELYSYFSEIISTYNLNAEVEITNYQEGWYSKDEEFVKEALYAVDKAYKSVGIREKPVTAAELGGNDGTFFDAKGMPVVAFGTMREENNVHAPCEFVYIRDIELLKNFIIYLLSTYTPG